MRNQTVIYKWFARVMFNIFKFNTIDIMGNNIGQAQSIASLEVAKPSRKGQWAPVGSTEYCHIVQNVDSKVQAELYSVPRDGRLSMVDDISRYEYRRTQNDNLVQVYQVEKESARHMCQGVERLRVKTERIPVRLSQLNDLPAAEGLYVLHEALKGYKVIYEHDGPININDDMIGFTPEGRVKVWLNENFAKNLQEPSNFRQRFAQQGNPEGAFVSRIFHIVEEHIQGGQYLPNFKASFQSHPPASFTDAINFVRGYATASGINIPGRLTSQSLARAKATTTVTTGGVVRTTTTTETVPQQQSITREVVTSLPNPLTTSTQNPLTWTLRPVTEAVGSSQPIPTSMFRSGIHQAVIPQQQIVLPTQGSIKSQRSITAPQHIIAHRHPSQVVGSFPPASRVTEAIPIRPQVNINVASSSNIGANVKSSMQLGRQVVRVPDVRKEVLRPSIQIKPQSVIASQRVISTDQKPLTSVVGVQQQQVTTGGARILQHLNQRGGLVSIVPTVSTTPKVATTTQFTAVQQPKPATATQAATTVQKTVTQTATAQQATTQQSATVQQTATASSTNIVNGGVISVVSDKYAVKIHEGKTIVLNPTVTASTGQIKAQTKTVQVQQAGQTAQATQKVTVTNVQPTVVTQPQIVTTSFRGLPHRQPFAVQTKVERKSVGSELNKLENQVTKVVEENRQYVSSTEQIKDVSPETLFEPKPLPHERKVNITYQQKDSAFQQQPQIAHSKIPSEQVDSRPVVIKQALPLQKYPICEAHQVQIQQQQIIQQGEDVQVVSYQQTTVYDEQGQPIQQYQQVQIQQQGQDGATYEQYVQRVQYEGEEESRQRQYIEYQQQQLEQQYREEQEYLQQERIIREQQERQYREHQEREYRDEQDRKYREQQLREQKLQEQQYVERVQREQSQRLQKEQQRQYEEARLREEQRALEERKLREDQGRLIRQQHQQQQQVRSQAQTTQPQASSSSQFSPQRISPTKVIVSPGVTVYSPEIIRVAYTEPYQQQVTSYQQPRQQEEVQIHEVEVTHNKDSEVVYEHHQYQEERGGQRIITDEYVETYESQQPERNLREARVGDQQQAISYRQGQPIIYDQRQTSEIVYNEDGEPVVYKTEDIVYEQNGQLVHDQIETVYDKDGNPVVYETQEVVYEQNGQIVHQQRETLYDQDGEQMVYESQQAIYEDRGQIVTEHHEAIDYQDDKGQHHVQQVVYDVNEHGHHTQYYQSSEAVDDGNVHYESVSKPVKMEYDERQQRQQIQGQPEEQVNYHYQHAPQMTAEEEEARAEEEYYRRQEEERAYFEQHPEEAAEYFRRQQAEQQYLQQQERLRQEEEQPLLQERYIAQAQNQVQPISYEPVPVDYNEEVNVLVQEDGEPVGYQVHQTAKYEAPEGGKVVVQDNYQVIEGQRGQTEVYTHVEKYVDESSGYGAVTISSQEEIRYSGSGVPDYRPIQTDYKAIYPTTTSEVVSGGVSGVSAYTSEAGYKGSSSINSTLAGSYNAYPVGTSYDPLSTDYTSYGANTYNGTSNAYGASSSSYTSGVSSSYPSYQPNYKPATTQVSYTAVAGNLDSKQGTSPASGIAGISGLTDYGVTGTSSDTYNFTSGTSTQKYDVSNLTYTSGKYDVGTAGITGLSDLGITGSSSGLAGASIGSGYGTAGIGSLPPLTGLASTNSYSTAIDGLSGLSSSLGSLNIGGISSLGATGLASSSLSGSGLVSASTNKSYDYSSPLASAPYPAATAVTNNYSSSSYSASSSSFNAPTYEALRAEYSTPSYTGLTSGGIGLSSDVGTTSYSYKQYGI